MCSDSYHPKGDAAHNIIVNRIIIKKTIVKPNSSFDLCRLGCSLYDYFI